jgi:hypothetical protein
MKKFVLNAALAASMMMGTAAHAVTTLGTFTGVNAVTNGIASMSGATLYQDFTSFANGSVAPAIAGSDGYVQSMSTVNLYSNPNDFFTPSSGDGNKFYSVPQALNGANMGFRFASFNVGSNFNTFGLLLGSPDGSGNQIQFTYGGVDIAGAVWGAPVNTRSNDQSAFYVLSGFGTADGFRAIADNNVATEFDSVYVSAIPEPGEWAMMIAGLGVVSVIARRRKKQA